MTAVASGRRAGGHPDVPRWAATTARKKVIGLLLALIALGVIALFSIAVGSRYIPPGEVLQVLLHPDDSQAATIVHSLRVPRTALPERPTAAASLLVASRGEDFATAATPPGQERQRCRRR